MKTLEENSNICSIILMLIVDVASGYAGETAYFQVLRYFARATRHMYRATVMSVHIVIRIACCSYELSMLLSACYFFNY